MKDCVHIVTFPLYKASSITGMKFKPQFWGKKIVDRLNSKSLKNINITINTWIVEINEEFY